jgi:solute carrier family 25 carnitine/acylcarnitine transporter 20/29
VLVGHPFDTIKVKLQTDSRRTVPQLLRQESPSTLYRGISSPLLCLALINAIVFGAHAQCLRLYDEHDRDRPITQAKCGFVAGAAQTIISAPMELVRSRMQTQTNQNGTPTTLRAQLKHLLAQPSPFRSLYRGYALTFARDSPAFAVYFGSYEWMLQWMTARNAKSIDLRAIDTVEQFEMQRARSMAIENPSQPSNAQILIAGGLAGMLSWFICYPADVLKTQVQIGHRTGAIDCLRHMYNKGGLPAISKGLTRGMMTTLLRAFPVNAASFFAYDFTIRHF